MTEQTDVDFEIPVTERLQAAMIDLLKQFFAFITTSKPYRDAFAEWRELPADLRYNHRSYSRGFDYSSDVDAQIRNYVQGQIACFTAEATMRAQISNALASRDQVLRARSEVVRLINLVTPDQGTLARALIRQAEAVIQQTRTDDLDYPVEDFSGYVRIDDDSEPGPAAAMDKFAERFATLEKAMSQAARAHGRACNTRSEVKKISRAIEKHYEDAIEFPSKPTAEEVYLFITRWTEWTKQLFALEREARLAVIAFKNASLPRKLALRELENAMQNVPSAKALTDFKQIALVIVSEWVRQGVVDGAEETECKKVDSIPVRQPAVDDVDDPEKEKQLMAGLREVTEVFCYALAAKRMAGAQLDKKVNAGKPLPPVTAAAEAGEDWLQKAIEAYQVSLERREQDIDRASRMHAARSTQLDACRFQMNAARAKCHKRAETATDNLLIPIEVARQLSELKRTVNNNTAVFPSRQS